MQQHPMDGLKDEDPKNSRPQNRFFENKKKLRLKKLNQNFIYIV